jgi:predicted small secreted protein
MKTVQILCGVVAAAALGAIASMSGCNTTKGAAQDVQSVGGHIEHAAENNGARND